LTLCGVNGGFGNVQHCFAVSASARNATPAALTSIACMFYIFLDQIIQNIYIHSETEKDKEKK
jgi:hypothetical protein